MTTPSVTAPPELVHAPAHGRPKSPAQPGYLPTLDGWRAVAIALVISAHSSRSIGQAWGAHAEAFLAWLPEGGLGVQIFFAISGFLICTRLLSAYRDHGHVRLKVFYIRRAHRILPASAFFLTSVGILSLCGMITLAWQDWLRAVCFVANYGEMRSWYVDHFWSLSLEEHFYLFFPLLLAASGKRRAIWFSIVLACSAAAWRAVLLAMHLTPHWGLPMHRTDSAIDGLLWGCVAAFLFHEPKCRAALHLIFNRATFWASIILLIAACFRPPSAMLDITWTIAEALLSAVIVVATVLHPHWMIGKVLEQPLLRWVGRLSYSLYLWQQLFLVMPASRMSLLGPLQNWPINVICLFAIAAASYYWIEKPFIREGYRITEKKVA